MFSRLRWPFVALCLLACGDDDATIQVPARPDAGLRDAGEPDAVVRECEADSQCNDGIDCTLDLCTPAGQCIALSDASRCSDGVFCNGAEQCDPSSGCVAATPLTCTDEQVCTIDRCDEASKRCIHRPRDFDGDGEVDFRCSGGTDCNDFEPTQGAFADEVCGDNTDNDCDGSIDETECGAPRHDTCDDAVDISGGGTFQFPVRGARPDYALSCAASGERDVVAVFTLDAPMDVTFEARGLWADGSLDAANVGLRATCDESQTELACATGFPAEVRTRALPAGDYFVIASTTVSARDLLLKLVLSPPTQAPTNMSCAMPMNLENGGRVMADFVDVSDALELSCGFPGAPDLTYAFTVPETSDVVISSYLPPGERLNLSLRTVCDDANTELRCVTGAPANGRFRSLAPGDYFLVVEGPFAREVDFNLEVRLESPTQDPAGDSCATAIELPLSTTLSGTLEGQQDFVATCGFFYRDAVYSLTIDEATDVRVSVSAEEGPFTLAVQGTCDDVTTQVSCVSGLGVSSRLRNVQPGDYTVVVEAQAGGAYSLFAELLPVTVPVAVEDNDTCATAFELPSDGGLFVGSTVTLLSDYKASCGGPSQSKDAVYKLTLPEQRRVRVTLEGGYDTVLYRFHNGASGDPSVCVAFGESSCNDDFDISTRSVLDETLSAGVHYYVVSGFGGSSSGDYVLEVDTMAQ